MAFAPLAGHRFPKVTAHRTKVDWARYIQELVDAHYPKAEKIPLILDNLNTHNNSSLDEAFAPYEAKRMADKLEIHDTPNHGSWFNIAEIALNPLSRQGLDERIERIKKR